MAASPSPSTSILSSLPEACNDTSSNGGSAGNPVSNDTFDQHTLLSAYVAQKHAQGCKHIDNQRFSSLQDLKTWLPFDTSNLAQK
jgi:hypothetical protein